MAHKTPQFPGFHRRLFGRPPVSKLQQMARKRNGIEKLCLAQLASLFGTFLPSETIDAAAASGANSRKRIFTPAITFWAFLSQVLVPGSSCRKALANVQTLFAARGLELPSCETKAYCNARKRLPVRMLQRILDHVVRCLRAGIQGGARTLVVDGSTLKMPDTATNQAKYPQHMQKPGCGFPMMKLVGLFCLDSGAWIATAKSHYRVHESRLLARLLRRFRPGDTLVADRAYCSYWMAATLMARGVDFVMRNHQHRKADFRKGKRLGKGDHCIVWEKPRTRPSWMSKIEYDALPDHLVVRETRLPRPKVKGYRTGEIVVVSSFIVPEEKSIEELGEYFLKRWRVELFFEDIKTSQQMEMLRTKCPPMICRELLMHMIAYNLIRAVALRSSPHAEGRLDQKQILERVSYKGTADRLAAWSWAIWAAPSGKKAQALVNHLHETIAEDLVPERPGRREPRVLKRRPKNYQYMTKPRHRMREIPHRNVYRAPA